MSSWPRWSTPAAWAPARAGLPRIWRCSTAVDLVAAAPAYRKTHSWGEFVFDFSWAQAYERHGLRYYPKLLCAVPFSPINSARLLLRPQRTRRAAARRS